MNTNFNAAAEAILDGVVTSTPRVSGVVAMVTDRHRNIYEGAAGKRRLDQPADMTTDSVFAIFSTTRVRRVLGHPDSSLGRSGVVHRLHEFRDRVLREPEAAKRRLDDRFRESCHRPRLSPSSKSEAATGSEQLIRWRPYSPPAGCGDYYNHLIFLSRCLMAFQLR
jgi:hypothetical protein